ncbi:TIGR02117 family protein [Moheibacter stercoris]|uniref:Uncharacterized protein (TIGR02117 family) n=1 Tax=Moheibacter stercoris TaxID=1628251 RepID=A0ABV2LWF6_9FLAO
MKKLGKKIFRGFLVFIGLILLYGVAVFVFPLIPVNANQEDADEITIYILTNGVHTDIVCPIKNDIMDWTTLVPTKHTKSQNSNFNYASFGWGDKGFYLDTPTWADLKFRTAFNAAFWLGESAMHVTFYRKPVESESCKKLTISKENYQLLVNYIKDSFDYENEKTVLIPTDMVYGDNDSFYDAKRTYNIFFTCNTWANSALKAANQKAALWTATDKGIFRQYSTN